MLCVCYNSYTEALKYLYSINSNINVDELYLDLFFIDNSSEVDAIAVKELRSKPFNFNLNYFKTQNLGYFPSTAVAVEKLAIHLNTYDYTIISNVDLSVSDDFFSNLKELNITQSVGAIAPTIYSADIYVVDKLLGYSESKYGQSMSLIKGSLLVYLPLTCVFIGYQEKIKKSMKHYDLTLVIILYSLFMLLAFSDFLVLSERLFRLFAFLLPIAVGYIFYVLRQKEKTMLTALAIIALNFLPYITDVGPYRLID